MAEIIDILATHGDEAPTFIVDTAQKYVSLTQPVSGLDGVLGTSARETKFYNGDNLILLSIGCMLPIGFEFYEFFSGAPDNQGRVLPEIFLNYRKDGAGSVTFDPRRIWLPYGNYELNTGVFLTAPTDAVDYWEIICRMNWDNCRISMVNVPAVLQGDTFSVQIYWKVLHTLALRV